MGVSGRANGVSFSGSDDWEQDEKILQPFTHLLNASSKGIRDRCVQAFNYWLDIPADKIALLEEVFQMIHLGVIPIDDIQDNSSLRRGIPAAHRVYGVASTISAAMYVILVSLQRVLCSNQVEVIKLYTEMMVDSWRGQAIEIYWLENYICPSEEEYLEMAKRKTTGLFSFGLQMMQLCSENKADFTKLTEIFGRYNQIRDDYRNLGQQEFSQRKGYCDDITEGKFTFPIIHAIKSRPNDHQVSNILRQRTADVELKKYCVSLLEKFGSLSYTRHTLEELDAELRAEVAKLGGNPLLEDVLDELLNWKRGTHEKKRESEDLVLS